MKQRLRQILLYLQQNRKKVGLITAAVVVGSLLLVQLLYPGSRLLPGTTVDGYNLSAWKKADALWYLNTAYKKQSVAIMYGQRTEPRQTPAPHEFGLTVSNEDRFTRSSYPWWLRLVPTSLFWGSHVVEYGGPTYTRDNKALQQYVDRALGDSCNVKPKNATLKVKEQQLTVVSSIPGGTCRLPDVVTALQNVQPQLPDIPTVRIDVKETPADISDADAKAYAQKIMRRIENGIPLQVAGDTLLIAERDLYAWLEFGEKDGKIVAQFSAERARTYFEQYVAPKVTVQPGVSKVTTRDFQEVSRSEGEDGRRLDLERTLAQLAGYANNTAEAAAAVTAVVPARVEYTRTYSPTDKGLSALLENYAKDHPGRYGISLIELSGQRRRANYNGDVQFVTASTYKLYVAYSTLKRVEDGDIGWKRQISGGRDLETCFRDMIVRSDNACAEALVDEIGYRALTDEARSIGAARTTFVDLESYKTTANDLSHFTASLESGQLLDDDSRERLLTVMRQNIFRQGIPAGVKSPVANKVGFLDGYLHDAAIVYSPNGTYALSILTEDSSWAHIAELARQIDSLLAK